MIMLLLQTKHSWSSWTQIICYYRYCCCCCRLNICKAVESKQPVSKLVKQLSLNNLLQKVHLKLYKYVSAYLSHTESWIACEIVKQIQNNLCHNCLSEWVRSKNYSTMLTSSMSLLTPQWVCFNNIVKINLFTESVQHLVSLLQWHLILNLTSLKHFTHI